jgi:hypothetical protein
MVGSGPEDGDVLAMGPDKPRRSWAIGRRARLALIGGCALLAVAGTLAGLRLSSGGPADPALARLITEVTTVRVTATGGSVYASVPTLAIGVEDGIPYPAGSNGRPLTSAGKPEVFYVGTEYCPYCVARSWPLIVALSQFGTFSGLSVSRSPKFDGIEPIDGWTFYGTSYTSRYLAFVPVETYSNVLVTPTADPDSQDGYRRLERLSPAEQALFSRYDHGLETPFTDFGGTAIALGSDVDPSALAGLTWTQIASDLRRPSSAAGHAILFSAYVLTGELCGLTGDRPAAVCKKN